MTSSFTPVSITKGEETKRIRAVDSQNDLISLTAQLSRGRVWQP